MNTRDPFNLRAGKTAYSYLQANSSSSPRLSSPRAQAQETGDRCGATSRDTTSKPEDMSFSVPRNVPNFGNQQRHAEDYTWGSSRRSRYTVEDGGAGVAEKISGIFGEGASKGLPMYKDKPYNYAASRRRLGFFGRKRFLAFICLVLFAGYYFLFPSRGIATQDKKATGKLSFLGKTLKSGAPDWESRREAVRNVFKQSWSAYEKHAWGYDEYLPVSKKGRQMVKHGMGWIIVDALDTMILMNLTTELAHARDWMKSTLDYDVDHDVNTFETTIRMLGGLLSAHYLSSEFPDMAPLPIKKGSNDEDFYLEKASDLADRLLGAYDSLSGIPFASVNLHKREGILSHADNGASSTAEATTLQLEMKYMTKLTGETQFWEKAELVMKAVDDCGAKDGLVPIFVQPQKGEFSSNNIRLGSRGDSYYEYLIKQYLQTSKEEPIYLDMWEQALTGVRNHLITYSSPSNFTVLAERPSGIDAAISPKMDHLVCFMPGTIALGATGGLTLAEARTSSSWGKKQEADMDLARELMKTCWGMYKVTATGLAPEITYFNIHTPPKMMRDEVLKSPEEFDPAEDAPWRQDFDIKPMDRHNLQRPETLESLFYMWRITGEQKYREWGWEMFESFIKYTAVDGDGGFTSIDDVTKLNPPKRNNMESFWLAETLKYFYLLFGPDDILPLDKVIFNTEAHPLPRFQLGKLFKTGWARKPRDANGNIIRDEKSI